MAPPKKYLLHDREIHSVLHLGHFESLYHVMYFFAVSVSFKFSIFWFAKNLINLEQSENMKSTFT